MLYIKSAYGLKSMNINEKRLDKRLTGFWRTFRDGSLWGYVLDISSSGIKMILNKKEHIVEDSFSIEIYPPDDYHSESIEISVKKAWVKKIDELFDEVGCYFLDLSPKEEDMINKLVNFFESYDKSD